ncbi:MAG: Smr/MutS family protein [Syntrophorhabdales bacterium]|jgi:DNA mismatch repair protein MutS2
MADKTLEYVGYLKLLEVVARYSSTSFISEEIHNLRPLRTVAEIEGRQGRIGGVLEIITFSGPLPLSDIPDIRKNAAELSLAEFTLEIKDFLAIAHFLASVRGVTAFLKKAPQKGAYIESILEGLKGLPDVSARIGKTINEEGFIEDSASYELSKIRADLYQLKERARRSLERIMERDEVRPVVQDTYIAVRNGRYVIPLKPNYNQFFQGIVHDYSHSLKTSFVEPVETMEVNNTISVLEKEEKEEEKRVLTDLTRWVRRYASDLAGNVAIIADLDFHHALALFASAFGCVRPQVDSAGSIEIRGAVNPFILLSKGERAVPIDILIGEERKATIISGPNADGKTVALKTAGLLLMMASAGMFIPARETPRVPVFPRIYAVMGDEQDISMELSTFTAHVDAIRNVYDHSTGGELVLIDEIGGGTEPQEASALSMGIIDAFVEKGCRIIVTTHLNLLKAYGFTHPFAMNVATDFDNRTMKPLYTLLYGLAGVSNAIKVAEASGMPRAIVEKSVSYLGKQEYVLNDLITGLETEKKAAAEERKAARLYREEMAKRLATLKEKRDGFLKGAEERCQGKVTALEAELEEIRKEIAARDRESLRKARERVSVVKSRFAPERKAEQGEIHVGDYVRVRTIGKEGYVAGIDGQKGMAEIVIGNMRMRIRNDYIEKVKRRPEARENRVEVNVADIAVPEINVRGLRVEEALDEIDRFVDRAIVHGTPQLKILHGIGTGRLMHAIRDHLSEAGHVKELKKDEKNSGVTIVELL